MSLAPFTTAFTRWYEQKLAHPEQSQRAVLQRILSSVEGSPVGRALNLQCNTPFEEFLAVAPRGYEFYEQFVRRVLDGDRHTFGRNPTIALGETSGSMGSPKMIPQSTDSLRRFAWFVQTVLIFQLRDGKSYLPNFTKWLLVAASSTMRLEGGVPVGFISGLMHRGTQASRPGFILPSPQVAAVVDWQERINRSITEAIPQRVGTLFGVPAYLLNFLRSAQQQTGQLPGAVWPLLKAVYYSGTSIEPHRAEIERLLDEKRLIIRGLYLSTEGFFGAELDSHASGQLRLMPDMAVFAFRDANASEGRLQALWQLERGRQYEVIVTTFGGLCQYQIGDVIEVTQTSPLLVRIVGRVGEEINLATEKLSVKQAQTAMARIGEAIGCSQERFMALPDPTNPKRHLWIVEQLGASRSSDAAQAIDRVMGELNPSYAALRAGDAMLAAPRVILVPRGTFDAYIKQGFARRGQFKFKHIFASAEKLLAAPGLEGLVQTIHGNNV